MTDWAFVETFLTETCKWRGRVFKMHDPDDSGDQRVILCETIEEYETEKEARLAAIMWCSEHDLQYQEIES